MKDQQEKAPEQNLKARFFAQYWGQKVLCNENYQYIICPNSMENREDGLYDGYLLLKPLSSISDEDAIEVAKIFNSENIKREPEFIELNRSEQLWLWFDGEILGNTSRGDQNPLGILQAYDFLRSKGYALPFMQYSVDKLIEKGWIKLQDSK